MWVVIRKSDKAFPSCTDVCYGRRVAVAGTSREHKQKSEGVGPPPPQPQTGVTPTSESGKVIEQHFSIISR